MALVRGTNHGFCLARPTADPAASNYSLDNYAFAGKYVAPAGATAITEIGWWCDGATEAANYQVGLYSHDAVNNEPEDLLVSSGDVAKGTTAGWKYVAVDFAITPGTTYWIAVQLDNTATATNLNYAGDAAEYSANKSGQTELPSNWGTSGTKAANAVAFYAVYTIGGTEHALNGSMAASATLTGGVIRALALSGAPAASAGLSGPLAVSRTLSGASAAQAMLTASLSRLFRVSGQSAATSALSATLLRGIPLSGAVDAVSVLQGALDLEGYLALAGAIGAQSGLSAAMSVRLGLAGQAAAQSGLTGALAMIRGFGGSTAGVTTITGAFAVLRDLAGQIPALSQLLGDLRIGEPFLEELLVTSYFTRTVAVDSLLARELAVESRLTCEITTEAEL